MIREDCGGPDSYGFTGSTRRVGTDAPIYPTIIVLLIIVATEGAPPAGSDAIGLLALLIAAP
jgi:hypothetical protein